MFGRIRPEESKRDKRIKGATLSKQYNNKNRDKQENLNFPEKILVGFGILLSGVLSGRIRPN